MKTKKYTLIFGLFIIQTPLFCQNTQICNGSANLCNKRFNEVTRIGAHNAQSYKKGSVFDVIPGAKEILNFLKIDPDKYQLDINDQEVSITDQLEKYGVRNLHIAIHPKDKPGSEPYVCHGFYPRDVKMALKKADIPQMIEKTVDDFLEKGTLSQCFLDPAARPLQDALKEVKTFLEKHPNEVLGISFGGTMQDTNVIAKEVQKADLKQYAHGQDPKKPWPTLGEMIKDKKRLVIFVKKPATAYPWLTHGVPTLSAGYGQNTLQKLQQSTTFSKKTKNSTAFKNKDKEPKNTIMSISHNVTPIIAGSPKEAQKANNYSLLKTRVDKLIKDADGIHPSVITFDFVNINNKDIQRYVDELNSK